MLVSWHDREVSKKQAASELIPKGVRPPPLPTKGRREPSSPMATAGTAQSAAQRPPPSKPSTGGKESENIRQIGVRHGGALHGGPSVVGVSRVPVVGIDFGTTYSKVALVHDGEVVLIEDTASKASSRAAIPSAVAYLPNGSCVVGEPAREMLATEPARVITSIKRVMGLSYSDPLANGLLGSLACSSKQGPNDSILFEVNGNTVTVPEVVARILAHLRDMASKWVAAKVTKAVFTAPVEFDTRAKRELELAARMAGIEIIAIVPEPVAAAMGCGYDGRDDSFVAVYDFGGGTFDASIVEVARNSFAVRGAAGDRWLGGDDFDELLAKRVADEFQQSSGISLHNRLEAWQRLLFASEEAKRWLSALESVDVVLPEAANTEDGPLALLIPVSRPDFVEITGDVIASSLEIARSAAMKARVHPRKITALLITGGTTRIPSVRAAAEKFFGRKGVSGIHPEHAVVIGAAVRAAVLTKMDVPQDFVERLRGLGRVGRDIGLALAGGTTEHIIRSDQIPPTAAHRIYSTSRDDQSQIRLEIVAGSSTVTAENSRVGGFIVEGLPPRPAGAMSLDVYFELSTTGTLYVTAQERSTGQRAQGTFDLLIT